jgi:hypothetical protein
MDSPPVPNAGAQEGLPPRTVLEMDLDWRFSKADYASAALPAFGELFSICSAFFPARSGRYREPVSRMTFSWPSELPGS